MAEDRIPVPADRKIVGPRTAEATIDYDACVPWHRREYFQRLQLANFDLKRALELRDLRYDELAHFRWSVSAKNTAENAYHEYLRSRQPKPNS